MSQPQGQQYEIDDDQSAREPIGFREFVALIAAVMALVALAIDSMLPALPAIATSLRLARETDAQFIIAVFMVGFGAAQLVIGVLSDRFGRRRLMLGSLCAFALFSVAAAAAPDFQMLLMARFFQGAAAAGGRVLVTTIVRDLYAGRKMARVMSLAQILFLAAPVVAPTIGQAILAVAHWRWIFIAIGSIALMVLIWTAWRLPETLAVQNRLPLNFKQLQQNFRVVLTERQSLGYTFAATLLVGGLMGFLNSVQPIFSHVFARLDLLAPIFGLMAIGMGFGSYFNARMVERLGMRKISHTALLGFIFFSALHVILALISSETVLRFAILQSGMMICFVLAAGNFSAMAMEHVGRVAGTASSIQGSLTTIGGALLGILIGQLFNNTVLPLYIGCCVFGLTALGIVLITERGKLFVPQNKA